MLATEIKQKQRSGRFESRRAAQRRQHPQLQHFWKNHFWPSEQNRIAVTLLVDMPDIKWEKVEDGKYYMSRTQYDMGNEQL